MTTPTRSIRFAFCFALTLALGATGCKIKLGSAETDASSASGSAAPLGSSSEASRGATCEQACARRRECKVPGGENTTVCVAECKSLSDLYSPEVLADYVRATCGDVTDAERGFRSAMACDRACLHRAECVPGASDLKKCRGDCIALGEDPAELDRAYTQAPCSVAKSVEKTFQQASSCIRGCRHVLECKVAGDLESCVSMCTNGIQKGSLAPTYPDQIAAADCATVARTVKLPARPQAAAARPAAARPATPGPAPGPAAIPDDDDGAVEVTINVPGRPGGGAAPPPNPGGPPGGGGGVAPPMPGWGNGSGCSQNGAKDCPFMKMCCAFGGGGAPPPGQGGTCSPPALCLAP